LPTAALVVPYGCRRQETIDGNDQYGRRPMLVDELSCPLESDGHTDPAVRNNQGLLRESVTQLFFDHPE